ncbi:MAG: winged helix-turn-helix transcriptional regulator [Desulfurococcales archaeon]|nr:winged helix-turn-helix transcriptional regulator [Desulfurococcales archaeon]
MTRTYTGIVVALISMLVLAPLVAASQPYPAFNTSAVSCEKAIITVMDDGSAKILLQLRVNGELPAGFNLSIIVEGNPVYAEAETEGVVLPVEINNNTLTVGLVDGEKKVNVSYITLDLTSKEGASWILSYNMSCPTTLILPADAIPTLITPNPRIILVNNTVTYNFQPGKVTVRYYLAPTGGTTAGGAGGTGTGGGAGGGGHGTTTVAIGIAVAVIVAAVITYYLLKRRTPSHRGGPPISISSSSLDERDKKILEALQGSEKGLTASELMEKTGIPKTPLYRRLNKLFHAGLIEYYDESGVRRYRLKGKG